MLQQIVAVEQVSLFEYRFNTMSFKIASFNVNSIKMRLPNVLSWLDKNNIDVILMHALK